MHFTVNVQLLSYVYILVPSDPPQSVTAGVINATSAWIRWDPPPVHTWNGEISGYLVSTFFALPHFCGGLNFTVYFILF